ncbi:MAG: hypothetical protein NWE89_08770 [Candidatus Bathyarchaeota archaeon]|nr:hypothetical protein [Candidatus Bathyarchaeota archaeon]
MTSFLGTVAPLSSDLSLILQVLVLVTLTVGVFRANSRQFMQHGYVMLGCVVLNTVTVLVVMIPVVRGLIRVVHLYVLSLLVRIHAVVGVVVLALGYYLIWVWRLATPAPCFQQKRKMRALAAAWVLEAVGGIIIYYLLYM